MIFLKTFSYKICLKTIRTALLVVSFCFLSLTSLKGIHLERVFVDTQLGDFPKMKAFGNKLFVVIPYAGNSSKRQNYLYQYDMESNNWIELLDGSTFMLNDFDIDLKGNLWIAADEGLFKYDWKNWQKYIVNDSLKDIRKFRRLCIDSNNNIWVQTSSYFFYSTDPNHVKASYTEVYKFDGELFKVMEFNGPQGLFDMITDEGFITAFGKVFIHLGLRSKELIVYDNNTRSVIPLRSIHSSNSMSEICISQLFPDSYGNLWSANDQLSVYSDPGISIFKKDGGWETLTTLSNGLYNWRYSQELGDSTLISCNTIFEDKNRKIWIGGQRFFGFFDEYLKLRIPSNEFLDKCILYSWKGTKGYGGTDSSRISFLNILMHYYESLKIPEAAVAEVKHIAGTNDGSLWFAIPSFGILRYNPNGFNSVLSESSNQSDVMIYPQPILRDYGYVNLRLGEESQTCNIRLYSAIGSLVIEKKFDAISRQMQFPLSKSINPGCYFFEISYNGRLICKKVLITD